VLVRHAGGAAPERVHHHEPRSLLARVEQLAPEVRGGRERVPTPDEQVAGVRPLLRIDLRRDSVRHRGAGVARGGADRALEVGGSERVHHARGHDVPLDQPLGSHVAVGQDRLAAELLARAQQAVRDQIERLVPGGAPEAAVLAHKRVKKAVLGVDALQVVGDLAAEEADGDRVLGIAGHVGGPPVLDRHVHRAGVGTIVRAGAAHEASGHEGILDRLAPS
jgi:hypothetical protein